MILSLKGMDKMNYEAMIEGILFTMGQTVERESLAMALELPEPMVESRVASLMEKYEGEEHGLKIIRLENLSLIHI